MSEMAGKFNPDELLAKHCFSWQRSKKESLPGKTSRTATAYLILKLHHRSAISSRRDSVSMDYFFTVVLVVNLPTEPATSRFQPQRLPGKS
jgi:hypothetical protein